MSEAPVPTAPAHRPLGLLVPPAMAAAVAAWLDANAPGERVWDGSAAEAAQVESVLVWGSNRIPFSMFPALRHVASGGAGVEHILRDGTLPAEVRVTRFVDPSLTAQMVEYVVLAVLQARRGWESLRAAQREGRWDRVVVGHPSETTVAVLGLGELGGSSARALAALGFTVIGWSRSTREVPGVVTFSGERSLPEVLSKAQVVVSLLPHTPQTEGLLRAATFARLPRGAWVINAGRGSAVVEEDLLAALDAGHLGGACLDVTRVEPLPAGHPFWSHPKVILTMHGASVTSPTALAAVYLEELHLARQGAPSSRAVDRTRCY